MKAWLKHGNKIKSVRACRESTRTYMVNIVKGTASHKPCCTHHTSCIHRLKNFLKNLRELTKKKNKKLE